MDKMTTARANMSVIQLVRLESEMISHRKINRRRGEFFYGGDKKGPDRDLNSLIFYRLKIVVKFILMDNLTVIGKNKKYRLHD